MKTGIMLIAVNRHTSLRSLHQLLVAVFVITVIVYVNPSVFDCVELEWATERVYGL